MSALFLTVYFTIYYSLLCKIVTSVGLSSFACDVPHFNLFQSHHTMLCPFYVWEVKEGKGVHVTC